MSHKQLSPPGQLHGVARAMILAVLLTPWIFGYSDSHTAIVNHIVFTAAFGPVAVLVGVVPPAAKVLLVGAVWLVLSPWLLGYAADHDAWLVELVSGLVLIIVSANTLLRASVATPGHPTRRRPNVQEHRPGSGQGSAR
jgi:hypothetical protein